MRTYYFDIGVPLSPGLAHSVQMRLKVHVDDQKILPSAFCVSSSAMDVAARIDGTVTIEPPVLRLTRA